MQLPVILKSSAPWHALSTQEKKLSWLAANRLVGSISALHTKGAHVVQSIIGDAQFAAWDHYPDNDVRDNKRASQYFYHAHPGLQRPFAEHGHFHLFVHADTLGLHPTTSRYEPAPAHLIAVSMNAQGIPNGFFVVNRWVTKGPWLTLKQCARGLDHFEVKRGKDYAEINRFLHALVGMYRQPILSLLAQRDEVMQQFCVDRDRRSVFADRSIEVLCYLPISLMDDIEALEEAM
jgi:hypothetical protein